MEKDLWYRDANMGEAAGHRHSEHDICPKVNKLASFGGPHTGFGIEPWVEVAFEAASNGFRREAIKER